MASKNKAPAKAPEIQTIDIVDYLTERLEEKTGIEFARDAWENAAPDEYGVVELGDVLAEQWADGHLIDCIWAINIYLFIKGAGDTWPDKVQEALEELEVEGIVDSTYSHGRTFVPEVARVRWTWNVRAFGPLMLQKETENG